MIADLVILDLPVRTAFASRSGSGNIVLGAAPITPRRANQGQHRPVLSFPRAGM
jgi:hypothetical protein